MIPRTRNVWIPKSAWDVKVGSCKPKIRVHCQAWMEKGPKMGERRSTPALPKVWKDAKSESSFRLLCSLLILWLQDEQNKRTFRMLNSLLEPVRTWHTHTHIYIYTDMQYRQTYINKKHVYQVNLSLSLYIYAHTHVRTESGCDQTVQRHIPSTDLSQHFKISPGASLVPWCFKSHLFHPVGHRSHRYLEDTELDWWHKVPLYLELNPHKTSQQYAGELLVPCW